MALPLCRSFLTNKASLTSVGRIMTHYMNTDSRSHVWEAKEPIFEHRAGVAIDQALGNHGLTRMLVCSAKGRLAMVYIIRREQDRPDP